MMKRSPDLMMIVHLVSPDGRYDQLYLSNYALINLVDEIARLDGVGDIFLWASATTACASGSIPTG